MSRVRNNAKDRGGMRRGSSVGEALLLIVLTGGIFELERREMDGLPICGWRRGSGSVEMEMKHCCFLDYDLLARLFDVIFLQAIVISLLASKYYISILDTYLNTYT